MIDINELRDRAATFGSDYLTDEEWVAVIDRLEAAEKERDALRFEIQVREAERKRIEKERDNANVAVAGMVLEAERLRDENEAMKQQESLGTVQWIQGWPVVNAYEGVILEPNKPLYALPGAQPAPSINEGVRKVTLDFRWESEAQHHIPTIEIEFEPVSPESPNDAKSWQDRDRLAAMLTPEAKP